MPIWKRSLPRCFRISRCSAHNVKKVQSNGGAPQTAAKEQGAAKNRNKSNTHEGHSNKSSATRTPQKPSLPFFMRCGKTVDCGDGDFSRLAGDGAPFARCESLFPARVLLGHVLLEIRARRVAVPVQVPVVWRDELLEVQAGRIRAAVRMLVIGGDLLLEIQALRIHAADGGFAHGRQRGREHEEGDCEFHGRMWWLEKIA